MIRKSLGMTLIEVLLAVAIAGTALVILSTGAARAVAVFKRARAYQKASRYLGLGELEHPIVHTNDVKTLEVQDVDYDGYIFSRTVENDEDEDNLFLVTTQVSWQHGNKKFKESVKRYVLQDEKE